MARLGGLGIIHQFMSPEKRAEEIAKVKRADNARIEHPITIGRRATLAEAKKVMEQHDISSLLIADSRNKLEGILTLKDYCLCRDSSILVEKLMTPRSKLIVGDPDTTVEEARKIFQQQRIEKLPLVDKNKIIVGLITARDMMKEVEFKNAARDSKGRLLVGVAMGLNENFELLIPIFLKSGVDIIVLDTARGNSHTVEKTVKKVGEIKSTFPNIVLMVGNIDTPEAVLMLAKAGADSLKIGIGPGAGCKTREQAGAGIPQLTAIALCSAIARQHNITIIGDGGIKKGADFSKALGAGANAVMLGKMLAATDESAARIINDRSRQFKLYIGSSTIEQQYERVEDGALNRIRTSEGEPIRLLPVGPVESVVSQLIDGLRSSMSYNDSFTVSDHQEKTVFFRITLAGYQEGLPQITSN